MPMTWCSLQRQRMICKKMLDCLKCYCNTNELKVNVLKTKVMVFHRGHHPEESFVYNGKQLEIISSFCYLGFTQTVQLLFTQPVEALISKARARIGLLYAKLPIQDIPLRLVIRLFETYIAPSFHYGLPLWISRCSQASLQALDAVWTKFLKRYLGLPPYANNAIVLYISESRPLSESLKAIASQRLGGLVFPACFSGMKLSFITTAQQTIYDPIPAIPTTFWMSRYIHSIPYTKFYRHKIMYEIFDIGHKHFCMNTNFHARPEENCKCSKCNEHAHSYHSRYCTNA